MVNFLIRLPVATINSGHEIILCVHVYYNLCMGYSTDSKHNTNVLTQPYHNYERSDKWAEKEA